MIAVAGLTDGSRAGGVYRCGGDLKMVTTAVRGGGWATAVVAPADRTATLYDHLAAALPLPPWFGRNLDALWDVLTDLDRPTAMILDEWTRYARARPQRWAMILDLLTQRCALAPPFAVVLASAGEPEETQ